MTPLPPPATGTEERRIKSTDKKSSHKSCVLGAAKGSNNIELIMIKYSLLFLIISAAVIPPNSHAFAPHFSGLFGNLRGSVSHTATTLLFADGGKAHAAIESYKSGISESRGVNSIKDDEKVSVSLSFSSSNLSGSILLNYVLFNCPNQLPKVMNVAMKFGGSSIANAERIDEVSHLIKNQIALGYQARAVICSAMGKTTNSLLRYGWLLTFQNISIKSMNSILLISIFVPLTLRF